MWFSVPDEISGHLGTLQSTGPELEEKLEIPHLPREWHDFEADVSRNSPSSNFTKTRKAGIQKQEDLQTIYICFLPTIITE
jgi:hypothetical protein